VSDQSQNQTNEFRPAQGPGRPDRAEAESSALDGLAARLKKELSAREVSHHVLRGDSPEHVRVEFEVKPRYGEVGANFTKFVYNSKQGWSGTEVGRHRATELLPIWHGERRRFAG
jgi:hypothetical protein